MKELCCSPAFVDVMQFLPAGEVLIGCIDTTGTTKDANYVTIKVKWYIASMDPKMVVQVRFDNIAAIKCGYQY